MKSVGDFFSELTDIDRGFLRTTVRLVRRPDEVIGQYLSGGDTYVKPFKYALITSSIRSVLVIVYRFFFTKPDDAPSWRAPVHFSKYIEKLSDFTDNFFPFILMFTVIPAAVLLMRVFFQRKSFRELTVILLYAFGLYWLLEIFMIPVPAYPLSDLLEPLVTFIIVCICFRKVLGNNFLLVLVKWSAITFLMIGLFYYVIDPFVSFSFARVNAPQDSIPYVRPDIDAGQGRMKPALVSLDSRWVKVADDPQNRFVFFSKINDSISSLQFRSAALAPLWDIRMNHFANLKTARLVALGDSSRALLIISYGKLSGTGATPQRLLLVSENGVTLHDKIMDAEVLINDGFILDGKTVVCSGGRRTDKTIEPLLLTMPLSGGRSLTEEKSFSLSRPTMRFNTIYQARASGESISMTVDSYENPSTGFQSVMASEIVSIAVLQITLDTAIHVNWETPVFTKKTKYSPQLDYTASAYDTANKGVVISWSLADDDKLPAKLAYVDARGAIIWQHAIADGEFNFVAGLAVEGDWIYFCGNHLWVTAQHPLVSSYRLAFGGKIHTTGKDFAQITYGEFAGESNYYFPAMIVGDSSVTYFAGQYRHGLFGMTKHSGTLSVRKDTFIAKSQQSRPL